jgi:uncharacterized protein (DUF433 family)
MQLEDYFDFHSPDDIHLRGTEVGIEAILADYLDLALFAEEIPKRHPGVTLEQVCATLTYYWRNKAEMDDYLDRVRAIAGHVASVGDGQRSLAVGRLRAMVAKRNEPKRAAVGSVRMDDYFDFLHPLDIRVRGTRVGIETILWDYLKTGDFAEVIAARYPSLTLEKVYATITYYLHNQERGDAYLYQVEAEIARQREEFARNMPPGIARLRELSREREQARREALAAVPL